MPVLPRFWSRRGFWAHNAAVGKKELVARKPEENVKSTTTSTTASRTETASVTSVSSSSSPTSSIGSSTATPSSFSLSSQLPTSTSSEASSTSSSASSSTSTTSASSALSTSSSTAFSTSTSSSTSSTSISSALSTSTSDSSSISTLDGTLNTLSTTSILSTTTTTASSAQESSTTTSAFVVTASSPTRVKASSVSPHNDVTVPTSSVVVLSTASTVRSTNTATGPSQTALADQNPSTSTGNEPSTTGGIANIPAPIVVSTPVQSAQPSASSAINNVESGSNLDSNHVNVPVIAGVTSAIGALILLLIAAVLFIRHRSRRQTNAWRDRLLRGRLFAASPAPSAGSSSSFFQRAHARDLSLPIQQPEMQEGRMSVRLFGGRHQVSDSLTRPLTAAPVEPAWDMVAGPSDYFVSSGSGNKSGGGAGGGGSEAGGNVAQPNLVPEGHDSFYASDPFAAPPAPTVVLPSVQTQVQGHATSGNGGSLSTVDSLYSQDSTHSPGRGTSSPYGYAL